MPLPLHQDLQASNRQNPKLTEHQYPNPAMLAGIRQLSRLGPAYDQSHQNQRFVDDLV
jgi:hypothetical protein